jgi:hypothetical protein
MISRSKEAQPSGPWAIGSISASIVSVVFCCVSILSIRADWMWLGVLMLGQMAFIPLAIGLGFVAVVLRERWATVGLCVSLLGCGIYFVWIFVTWFLAISAIG